MVNPFVTTGFSFFTAFKALLEELVVLLIQAHGILSPELLGFVHRAPL